MEERNLSNEMEKWENGGVNNGTGHRSLKESILFAI